MDDEGDLEKDLTALSGNWAASGDEDSDVDVDAELRPRARRRHIAALLLFALAVLYAALVPRIQSPAVQMRTRSGSSPGVAVPGAIASPLPGISLQPSSHALPGVPATQMLPSLPGAALFAAGQSGQRPPSQSQVSVPSVVFGMLIENLDYAQLVQNDNLLATFNGTVKQAVASVAGWGVSQDDVSLQLSAGYRGSVVGLGMIIENLDYAQLVQSDNLLATFNGTVKQAVASVAGWGVSQDDVSLQISAGSVVVECTVVTSSEDLLAAVQAAIVSDIVRLKSELALNLRALAIFGIFKDIAMGPITVASGSDPVIFGTTQPPTTTTTTTTLPPGWTSVTTTPLPVTTAPRRCAAVEAPCLFASSMLLQQVHISAQMWAPTGLAMS
eukprot:CAMPEP_0183602900 /NCGR_PEP_ID=MMETSP0371-20130417/181178_1 /TAXON_ID=268820 /ORGANISM="Peridinium aciculiferum, Strain PAER-2" /LENGTH=384 /DNA_ID=CAMNT_0025814997 /DNA_START=71 /DNA_END=1225 /DNA_ORIENTATION=-